jgi:hypothetical protein
VRAARDRSVRDLRSVPQAVSAAASGFTKIGLANIPAARTTRPSGGERPKPPANQGGRRAGARGILLRPCPFASSYPQQIHRGSNIDFLCCYLVLLRTRPQPNPGPPPITCPEILMAGATGVCPYPGSPAAGTTEFCRVNRTCLENVNARLRILDRRVPWSSIPFLLR